MAVRLHFIWGCAVRYHTVELNPLEFHDPFRGPVFPKGIYQSCSMLPLLILQKRAAGLDKMELGLLICGIDELDTARSLGRFRYGQSN